MSGISSGVGLLSGLPTSDLIAQLMAIESRPLQVLQRQVAGIQAERTAYGDLSARLLALKSAITRFDEAAFFDVFNATSSAPDVVTASADSDATQGSFSFRVHSLVSTHELISQGFADADSTPVGVGTVVIESGQALLGRATDLERLNGGEGVRRGRIEITDRTGESAEIDLRAALTVSDVVDAINSQTAVNVRASVRGDRIVLEDLNDTALEGRLAVRDVVGGHMAEDLGIAGTVAVAAAEAARIEGADVLNIGDKTLLSTLNDDNGVGRVSAGADFTIQRDDGASFAIDLSGTINGNTHLDVLNSGNGVRLGVVRITTRDGSSAEVDLTGATNLQDVADAITGSGLDVGVTYFNSSKNHALQITDNTQPPETGEEETEPDDEEEDQPGPTLKIEDVSGFSARDLGIATETEETTFIGNSIHRVDTVGDVLRAIEYAYDADAGEYNNGRIIAAVSESGNGLTLSSLGVPRGFGVVSAEGSTAAADLGIEGRYDNGVPPAGAGRDLVAGLNTVLLHSLAGGSGVEAGVVRFTGRNGASVQIDFSDARSVQDVMDRINDEASAAGVALSASLNSVGNGILLMDSSDGSGSLVVEDVEGAMAETLNLSGSHDEDSVDSGNLQLQYVSSRTLLDDLNGGRGVRAGEIRITDAAGTTHSVNIAESTRTIGDVIKLINAAAPTITASINATGDGILITDTSEGDGTLTVEDDDGFAGRDLNLVGQAGRGENTIDGTFEIRVDVDADDTVRDLTDKINALDRDVSAAVINDGSGHSPYRLVISSKVTGAKGRLAVDGQTTSLSLGTLTEGRDAVVFLGGSDSESPLLVRSDTNTLSEVLKGVSLELHAPSDTPVTLSVAQDVDQIVSGLNGFVDAYNDVVDRIGELTKFDDETFERGVLFGDSTVSIIENRLFRSVTAPYEGASSESMQRLASLGITTADGHLQLDEDKFRQIYEEDPDAVEQLFTAEASGFGDAFEDVLDEMTRSFDGLIARRDSTLEDREELLQNRMEDMQDLLNRKQSRLERQFAGLESALASLQGQQTALASLQALAAGA